jgi:hypothetical protein
MWNQYSHDRRGSWTEGVVVESSLRREVVRGATITEVIKILKNRFPEGLRPIQFLWILQEELGVPFTESRMLLEHYDPEMKPIAPTEAIDELGRSILANVSRGR